MASPIAGVLKYLDRAEGLVGAAPSALGPLPEADGGLLRALADRIPHALDPLASWLAAGTITLPQGDAVRQSWWTEKIAAQHKAGVVARLTGRDLPRWEAQSTGRAGAWMSAPPAPGLGLAIPGERYGTLLRWHLGLPLLPADCAGRPCPVCAAPVDVFGDHAVCCVKLGFVPGTPARVTFFAGCCPRPGCRTTARLTWPATAIGPLMSCCGAGMRAATSR